jgi:5,10-methylenetetrahydromethanopterin reductase
MMADPLTLSVRCNNDVSVDEFVAIAVAAEGAGLDQIWVSDDLFYHSATVMLTAAALRTRRIRLGTGIVNPYSLHPVEMAMFARSLAAVSDGRALLGVAAGAEDFLSWIGVERRHPLAAVRATVMGLRHLLDDSDVHARPEGWTDDAWMRVGDEFEGRVPIYVGAMSPRMLALAGEVADGVLPLVFPPERYGETRAVVLDAAAAAGRGPDSVDVAACVWCSVSDDRTQAIKALAGKIAYFGPSFSPHVLHGIGLDASDLASARAAFVAGDFDEAVRRVPSAALRLGIAGNPRDIVERVSGLVDAGATHVSFGPPLGPDPIVALDLLRTDVIPRLKSTWDEPGRRSG